MLEIKNLSRVMGSSKAVDGVDMKISRGETVVIMGPSGCGKSTTIRCINRLTEPDTGKSLLKEKIF